MQIAPRCRDGVSTGATKPFAKQHDQRPNPPPRPCGSCYNVTYTTSRLWRVEGEIARSGQEFRSKDRWLNPESGAQGYGFGGSGSALLGAHEWHVPIGVIHIGKTETHSDLLIGMRSKWLPAT
jgi:hypothetical protein